MLPHLKHIIQVVLYFLNSEYNIHHNIIHVHIHSPSQVGGDPDHSPLDRQVKVPLPLSSYPSSQVYVAVSPTPVPVVLTAPLAGSDKASH